MRYLRYSDWTAGKLDWTGRCQPAGRMYTKRRRWCCIIHHELLIRERIYAGVTRFNSLHFTSLFGRLPTLLCGTSWFAFTGSPRILELTNPHAQRAYAIFTHTICTHGARKLSTTQPSSHPAIQPPCARQNTAALLIHPFQCLSM